MCTLPLAKRVWSQGLQTRRFTGSPWRLARKSTP
jgi:hypothetical protein